jgi:hypothetical protein
VKQQQDNKMSYVTELRPTDVLFGRGSGPNDHEGNIRFRQRVADRKDEYLATNHRMTKSKIAKEIVDSVLNENGRFLRKADEEETASLAVPDGVDVYVMVDDVTITEKAKQALRQNAIKAEAKPKKKQTTIDKLSAIELDEGNPEDYEPIPIVISSKLNEDNSEDYEPIPIVISNKYRAPEDQEPQLLHPPTTVSSAMLPLALAAPAAAPHWDDDNSRIPIPENINTHVNAAYEQSHATADPNTSMAQLTNELPTSSKTGSLSRNHSMKMDDLMDSFSKMKTATNLDEQKRMMGSVETMGTIDHLPEGASMNDMSLGSSTFSFFRGNDSMLMNSAMFDSSSQSVSPDRISSNPPAQNGASNAATSNSQSSGHSHLTSESSISLSDVWSNGTDSRRKSSSLTHSGITGEVAVSVKRVMDEVRREEEAARNARLGIFQQNPRQVALDDDAEHFNMSDLGSSTLDVLKPSMNSNNAFGHDLPSDSSAQR